MEYTKLQIQAAKENAELFGYQNISEENAIAYLDWYFANKVEYKSVAEAKNAGLSQKDPTGAKYMRKFWQNLLGERQ